MIYKLNIQIQISLVIGNLYSADLITGISSIKKKLMNNFTNKMTNRKKNLMRRINGCKETVCRKEGPGYSRVYYAYRICSKLYE